MEKVEIEKDKNIEENNKEKEEKTDRGTPIKVKVVDKRSSVLTKEEEIPDDVLKELEKRKPTYVEKLLSEIEEKKQQLLELSQAYRKLQADSEQFRIRLNKDVENRVFKGKASFLRDFLEVLDNLERGIEAAEKNKDFDSFLEGIKLIRSQFLQKVEKNGIKEINAKGEEFNPQYHEALNILAVDKKEEDNKVIEVVEKGYMINDDVLRPAKVIVGKFNGK
ncbi:MAG: nucleotide exchange factor GrpE [Candidatus Schekmanbacteria bacterium]|nr:MAG: nucleotide exchange factor GrpE [Candidatus Schekmanbacteria bacterium]